MRAPARDPQTLQVPQFRDGSFPTEVFARYRRSEQAFVLALMEMVVGVSSRKATRITEALLRGVLFKIDRTLVQIK